MTSRRETSEFSDAPWRRISLGQVPHIDRVPTMLARDEQKFYIWLTQDWAQGAGEIVDLGAFVGGSTARLAAGAHASRKRLHIHAYDKFTADPKTKANHLYANGVQPFEGNDILPHAIEFLAPWADNISLHRGQVEKLGWIGRPIEILVIDVFKKVELVDQMVEAFFPFLIPGRSLIVQQDYLHWSQPWIVAQMARFGEAFEPVAHARRDTVAFLLRKPITPSVLAAAAIARITDDEMQAAIADAKQTFAGWGIGNRLDDMSKGLAANPGARAPWQMTRPD